LDQRQETIEAAILVGRARVRFPQEKFRRNQPSAFHGTLFAKEAREIVEQVAAPFDYARRFGMPRSGSKQTEKRFCGCLPSGPKPR